MNDMTSGKLSRALFWCLLLFAFSSTFSIALSQFAVEVSVVLFIIIAIREKYRPFVQPLKWFYIAVGAYFAWMVFAALVNGTPLESLNNIREEWLFALIPVAIYWMPQGKNLDRFVSLLSLGVILVMFYSLWLLWGKLGIHWEEGLQVTANALVRIKGNFSHPLTFGNYSAMVALFLLAYRFVGKCDLTGFARGLVTFGGVAAVLSTVMSNSRGPLLALLVGLVLLLFFLRRKYIPVGLVLLLGVVGLMSSIQGISGRFGQNLDKHMAKEWPGGRRFIWITTLDIIEEHPVTGVGAGNFFEHYRDRVMESVGSNRWYAHAHNDLLNVSAIAGIPGGVLFAGMWGCLLLYLWIGYRRAGPDSRERRLLAASLLGSVVFLASSATEATFADEEARQVLMFIWAVGLSTWYKSPDQGKLTVIDIEP